METYTRTRTRNFYCNLFMKSDCGRNYASKALVLG